MKGLHKFISWYTQLFSFPARGWKFFKWWLQRAGLFEKTYVKKIIKGLFIYVTPSDHIQQQLFWYGHYEKHALLTWHSLINTNSVVLDVGANIGLYSLMAAGKAIGGKVYAFEAAPGIREQLERNILLNNMKTIVVLPFAAGDVNGPMPFYISEKENLGMSGLSKAENFSGLVTSVHSVRLDDWAIQEGLTQLDAVKIDVEGAEMLVLRGMCNLLEKFRPVVFIEVLNATLQRFDQQAADVYSLLQQLQYTPYEIVGTNRLQFVENYKESDTIVFLPPHRTLPGSISIQ